MSSEPIKLKYTPIFPLFMLVCCALILYATLVVGPSPSTITGLLLLPVSILMLTHPIGVVHADRIDVTNLLGRVTKSYPYASNPIAVRDNALFAGGRKLWSQWLVNTKLDTVKAYIDAQSPRIN